uniref:Cyclin A1 n=1 Tax=Solanum tuberosum TaxID=4113 RepID=M1CJA4_SOLTU
MVANSSGLENNQPGKLNARAAKKRPAISNISNHTTVSARNSISHSSKLVFTVDNKLKKRLILVSKVVTSLESFLALEADKRDVLVDLE